MSTDTIVMILIPLALATLMWGLGLNLTGADFHRVKKSPREVIMALGIQLIVIPSFAIFLNWAFNLPPAFAVGLLLLASTPGGPTANILSHLGGGNVALNVTLTAVNSLIAIVSVPAMVLLGYHLYFSEATPIPLQAGKLIQVVLIILIPMSIGMFMNSRNPALSKRFEKSVNRFAVIFLVGLIIYGLTGEWELISSHFATLAMPVLLFNAGAMAMAWLGSLVIGVSRKDKIAVIMELGIHNCTLALGIAMSPALLNSIDIALPSAVYVIFMYATAGGVAYWFRRNEGKVAKIDCDTR